MLRLLLASLFAIPGLIAGVSPATATPFTYNFVGTVIALREPDRFPFAIGDRIPVTMTVNPDLNGTGSYSNYVFGGPRGLLGIGIGELETGAGWYQDFTIANNATDAIGRLYDRLYASATAPMGGFIEIDFRSYNLDAITSTRIDGPINPALMDVATIEWHFRSQAPPRVTVRVDALAIAVPEPGTITIFGAALLALMLLARRVRPRREPPFIAD